MENCKCCGRTFNHHSFFYRPGVLSALEYACSLRCKNELVDAYTPGKIEKQKERQKEQYRAWSKRNTHASDGTELTGEQKELAISLNSFIILGIIGALIAAIAGA